MGTYFKQLMTTGSGIDKTVEKDEERIQLNGM